MLHIAVGYGFQIPTKVSAISKRGSYIECDGSQLMKPGCILYKSIHTMHSIVCLE